MELKELVSIQTFELNLVLIRNKASGADGTVSLKNAIKSLALPKKLGSVIQPDSSQPPVFLPSGCSVQNFGAFPQVFGWCGLHHVAFHLRLLKKEDGSWWKTTKDGKVDRSTRYRFEVWVQAVLTTVPQTAGVRFVVLANCEPPTSARFCSWQIEPRTARLFASRGEPYILRFDICLELCPVAFADTVLRVAYFTLQDCTSPMPRALQYRHQYRCPSRGAACLRQVHRQPMTRTTVIAHHRHLLRPILTNKPMTRPRSGQSPGSPTRIYGWLSLLWVSFWRGSREAGCKTGEMNLSCCFDWLLKTTRGSWTCSALSESWSAATTTTARNLGTSPCPSHTR